MRSIGVITLVGLALASLIIAYFLVEPAPPKEVRIAAGSKSGAYYPIALRLAAKMRPHGVIVQVLETHGAAQNLALMTGETPPELALIQGGTHPPSDHSTSHLRTLATVDLEPIWLLTRPGTEISSLQDFSKLAVAAGERGSGTLDLFRTLLKASGQKLPTETIYVSNLNAVEAVLAQQADLMFSVSPAVNPWLEPLFRGTAVEFVELAESEALTRQFPYLTTIRLPRSSIDIARSIPKRDLTVLATATNLVSTDRVHTATKMLALQALREIDHGTLLLDTDGQFPTLRYADYRIDPEARRFFATGPPFIRRYLPYWVANLLERFYAFLLPLLAVGMPLLRLVPSWIRKQRRKLTQRWYDRLAEAENAISLSGENEKELQRQSRQLDRLERQLEQNRHEIVEPQEYFSLRFHLERIRRQLWRRLVTRWLETGDDAWANRAGTDKAADTTSYRRLLSEIESDLTLFADLEARFKHTGIPTEFFGDIMDAKRGLRQARERLLASESAISAGTSANAEWTRDKDAHAKPNITLVSDRSEDSLPQLNKDKDD